MKIETKIYRSRLVLDYLLIKIDTRDAYIKDKAVHFSVTQAGTFLNTICSSTCIELTADFLLLPPFHQSYRAADAPFPTSSTDLSYLVCTNCVTNRES